ncbi:hypothetical protein [Hymenobacter cheonanensis]|nr:hypothetical protein [Hymenobacter sp. CA2-7]MDO7888068.1 hypothetical protein [Hymenobacter sp. CA2-7]
MKNLATPAKFTLTKTTVTRFTKAQQPAGIFNTIDTSVVPTTSVF